MIGRILSHLLGNAGEDSEAADDSHEKTNELEEEGWVIVNLPEGGPLLAPDVDPLENLLIEHPSMSVYQMRCTLADAEEEEEEENVSDEDEEEAPRPVAVSRHISWHLAAWGVPLPYNVHLLSVQKARGQAERKKLSRGALHRQNLAKARFSPGEKRFGHLKRPCQRVYNY
ncbi:si:ch211-260e23.9 [Kryptolebias marmoratus]|uniref:Si:ch211-260e23.9 n=1 Tax=Kryptolebias marmoratus TaxID=37003 RepID=A0A3Q3ANY6_KRYMA|nr:si:ch211-260e23.9 [Kryptolebias marmoratus]